MMSVVPLGLLVSIDHCATLATRVDIRPSVLSCKSVANGTGAVSSDMFALAGRIPRISHR